MSSDERTQQLPTMTTTAFKQSQQALNPMTAIGKTILNRVIVALLAFLVLAGLLWLYTLWQDGNRQLQQSREIDNEISARISRADKLRKYGLLNDSLPSAMSEAFEILDGSDPVYEHFQHVPLLALLHQQTQLVSGGEKTILTEAYRLAQRFAQQSLGLTADISSGYFGQSWADFESDWERFIQLERWGLAALNVPLLDVERVLRELDALFNAMQRAGGALTAKDIRSAIQLAIFYGSRIYNFGDPKSCARIYLYTANRLLLLDTLSMIDTTDASNNNNEAPVVTRARELLQKTSASINQITDANAVQTAWDLRSAFDMLLTESAAN